MVKIEQKKIFVVLVILILLLLCMISLNVFLYKRMMQSYNNESQMREELDAMVLAMGERDSYITPITSKKVHALVNKERSLKDLKPLKYVSLLEKSACKKADDMIKRNYWRHNTPEGVEPWQFILDVGLSYETAGENLAYGANTNELVVSSWMRSPGHRKNILEAKYTGEGICVRKALNYRGGRNIVVVQHFYSPWKGGTW